MEREKRSRESVCVREREREREREQVVEGERDIERERERRMEREKDGDRGTQVCFVESCLGHGSLSMFVSERFHTITNIQSLPAADSLWSPFY